MVISINGQKVDCTANKEALTTEQYQNIYKGWGVDKPIEERDHLKLFSTLCGKEFKGFVPTIENEQVIWDCIKWVAETGIDFDSEFPKVLEINGKTIELPRKVGALSIGQNIIMKQILSGAKFLEENISMAVAVYVQPIYDEKPFSASRAKELNEHILKMPAWVIYPIGFFLLNNVWKYGTVSTTARSRMITSLKLFLSRMWRSLRGSQNLHRTQI